MSWPSIAKCYDEIVKDPSLLLLFPEKGWTSLWELSHIGALWFRLISERLFIHIASPEMWGKAGVEFITCNDQKISGEATPMVSLVTNGVEEGNLGMVTTFCCHNQAKMEATNPLSALHQCDSLKPSMVVVSMYTNTLYIPWGTFHFLYLDVSTLYGGAFSAQFPLDCLHLHRLLPSSEAKVVLPQEEGEVGLKVFPHSWEVLWQSSGEKYHLSDLVLLSVCSSVLLSHQEEGTQMEKESDCHPAFQWLQDVNEARVQLECKLVQEAQEVAQRYDNSQIRLARKHERKWAKMTQEANATFQEVFL